MKLSSSLLSLHIAVLLLGMTGLFAKFLSLDPLTIICGRTFFTAIFLFGCLFFLKGAVIALPSNRLSLVSSGLVLCLHWYAFFHAIQLSTVAIGVIGFSTFPIFVTFLEPLLFRERLSRIDIASGVIVFIGLCVIAPELDFSHQHTVALVWAVFSGFLLAIYTLINRRLVRSNYFLSITAYQSAIVCIVTLPFVAFYDSLPVLTDIGLLVILGVLFTAIPQALLVRGLKTVRAQVTSVLVGLEPVYSIVFAIILLNEIPTSPTIIGGLIVVAAVALAMSTHRR